jgi:hypothetical protein
MVNFLSSSYAYFSPFETLYNQVAEQSYKLYQKNGMTPYLDTLEDSGRKMIAIDICTLIDNKTTTCKVYIYCTKHWLSEDWNYFTQSIGESFEQAMESTTILPFESRELVHKLLSERQVKMPNGMIWYLNRQ